MLTGYSFFTERLDVEKPEVPDINLSPALIEVVANFQTLKKEMPTSRLTSVICSTLSV